MSSNKDDDEARAPEWPVYHWDKVEYSDDHSDDHGPIARSGTSKKNPKIDDAKPVKPPDAIEKLKKDKQLAIKRKKEDGKKGGRRTRGKSRAKSRAKSRKKRRRKRRKSRRKSRRKKRYKFKRKSRR